MNRFEQSICFLLLFLFIAPSSLWAASGLSDSEPQMGEDPPTLVGHLRTELRAGTTTRQELALIDVIRLGSCFTSCTVQLQSLGKQSVRVQIDNPTGLGALLDLSSLSPDLLKLYHTGTTDGLRLLALSAIMGHGSEEVIESLISTPSSQSARVRELTQRVVAHYFFEVYPELLREGQKSHSVSLEEIAELRVERKRQTRRAARRAAKQAQQAATQAEEATAPSGQND